VLGGLFGAWQGFSGWPAWAAVPFLAGLGALIGYRAASPDRRALNWLILWIMPGALVGIIAGIIAQAAPLDVLHLALEFAIYTAVIGLLGPGNGNLGILVGGLLVGVLGLLGSLIGDLPEAVEIGRVQLSGLSRVQASILNTLQALLSAAVIGGLIEFAIRLLRNRE
jgi:hypothetical protein